MLSPSPTQLLLHPFLSLPLCVSLLEMNNVDTLIVLYEQIPIPWMRLSLRTGEPQTYLQALPSNLHYPSVVLIRRPWTRRHSNCSWLLQISPVLFLPCDAFLSSSSHHFFSPSHISFYLFIFIVFLSVHITLFIIINAFFYLHQ